MADGLLAQSAIDRLQSAAHELVLDGDRYPPQKPTVGDTTEPPERFEAAAAHLTQAGTLAIIHGPMPDACGPGPMQLADW